MLRGELFDMNKSKTLTSNFIFSLINQILAIVLPLITTPYVARVLGAVGNGQYSYAYSIAQYFVIFASLGFSSYGQREIAKCDNDINKRSCVFWELFILRFIVTLFSFTVFIIFGFSIGYGISSWLLMFAVSINIISVAFDLSFFFQGMEEFKMLAIRTIIIRLILVSLIFVFVRTANDVWLYALISVLATFGANLVMFLSLKGRVIWPRWPNLQFKKHFKPVLLLFIPNIAITLYSILDKTMINILTNGTQEFKDYSNGCYEQAYKINSLALIFVTVISSIFQSRNSILHAKNDEEGVKRNVNFAINYVWHVSVPLIFGFVVLSENLTTWFFGPGYDDTPLLMILMAPRFLFSGLIEIFTTQTLLVYNKEKYISISTRIAAVINICLNLVLIPFIGAVGAAIATAVCELANCMFVFYIAKREKYFNLKDFFKISIKPLISGLIMFAVIFVIQYFWNYSILSFVVIMLVGIVVYSLTLLLTRDNFAIFVVQKFFIILKKYFNSIKGRIKK